MLFASALSCATALAEEEGQEKKRPLVICGPSGVGKGTLISKLLDEFPNGIGFSVSHTTRSPRPGEVNGVHYHFVSKPDMERMIANGEFVEYAHVHGNIYGTSKRAVSDVCEQGKVCVLDIDVQGAKLVSQANLDAFFIFIEPPSMEALEHRLRGRGTETEEKIQLRLRNASQELASLDLPIWDSRLVNDNLAETYKSLRDAVVAKCMK